MKTKKISLAGIREKITRAEMKKVNGGCNDGCVGQYYMRPCSVDYQCYCDICTGPQPLYCNTVQHKCLFR